MVQWQTSKSPKQLLGFLGLTGYYRRFIKGYASIATPLTDLLFKDAFIWTPRAESSFQQLKQAMVNAPSLHLPIFDQDFCTETDASNVGISAVLMQDGYPLSYFSHKLGPRMQSAYTYIKELHPIVEAVRTWRQYLLGRFFIIRTDHHSIKELFQQVIQTPYQQKYVCKLCDASKLGGPLTTHQPIEDSWMSGNPTPHHCVPFFGTHDLKKIGQSPL